MKPRFRTAEDCPDIEQHTACPTGYLQWHDWAEKMSRTHRSTRCPTCGFYAVWLPKVPKKVRV